jgi:hypothetical protein
LNVDALLFVQDIINVEPAKHMSNRSDWRERAWTPTLWLRTIARLAKLPCQMSSEFHLIASLYILLLGIRSYMPPARLAPYVWRDRGTILAFEAIFLE